VIENLKSKLKTIDFSDVRLLYIALVLLLIPLLFFSEKAIGPQSGPSGSPIPREMAPGVGKGGFSYVQKTIASHGGGGGSAPEIQNMFSPPGADKEWESAVNQISQEPVTVPDDPNLTPDGRKILEAEMNPEIRLARDFLERGKYAEAVPLLKKILEAETDNVYLKAIASSDLCAAYEALGKQAELEKEFKRFVQLIESLPKDGGFYAQLSEGLQALASQKDSLGKAFLTGQNREMISKMLNEAGVSGQYTPEKYVNEMSTFFDKQFPGYKNFERK